MTQIGTQLGWAIEREHVVEQVQRQQEALLQQEKLAAMSSMLASVAHELNNPLTSIVLQAELLREDLRDSPLAEPVAEITQAAARCERLVRQFLTLARQHPPERTAVALNMLVAETVELLAYPFRVDNVAVHLHLDDQAPPSRGIRTNCNRCSSTSSPTRSRRSVPPRAPGTSSAPRSTTPRSTGSRSR